VGGEEGWGILRVVEEAVGAAADVVEVDSDDLAQIVDAFCLGAFGAQGIVEGGVGAAIGIVEEAVAAVVAPDVCPDDLARRGVDAECSGAGGQGNVGGGVGAGIDTVDEAVTAVVAPEVAPDDLARAADAKCLGAGGQGVVQGGVDVDWHDTGPSVINPKAEPLPNLLGLSCLPRAHAIARRDSQQSPLERQRGANDYLRRSVGCL